MKLVSYILLLFVFIILSKYIYSQNWMNYSDSVLIYFKKNDTTRALKSIKLVDSILNNSHYFKDTTYADYIYRKAVVYSSLGEPDTSLLKESLAIWERTAKRNFTKEMKIKYFLGTNYFSLGSNYSEPNYYDSSNYYYENCLVLIGKYNLESIADYKGILLRLSFINFSYKVDYIKAEEYSKKYVDLIETNLKHPFDFNYVNAYKFQKDTVKVEHILQDYLKKYIDSNLNAPEILFEIYFRLCENKISYTGIGLKNPVELIRYGEKALEIYKNNNLNKPLAYSTLLMTLESAYESINDKKKARQYRELYYGSQHVEQGYYEELQHLYDKEDFVKFKYSFDKYEKTFIGSKHYDSLLELYSFSVNLLGRNVIFSIEVVQSQLGLVIANRSSLSKEDQVFLDKLLVEFYFISGKYFEALQICKQNISTSNTSYKLEFYRFKALCELVLGLNENSLTSLDSALKIATYFYGKGDPRLLPFYSGLIDLNHSIKNKVTISNEILKNIYDFNLENSTESAGLWLSIGSVALDLKNLQDATKYFLKSKAIMDIEKTPNPFLYYSCLLKLGTVSVLEGNFFNAKSFIDKAKEGIDKLKEANRNIAYGDYYQVLALLSFYQDEFTLAKQYYEKSFTYSKDSSVYIYYLMACYFIDNDVNKVLTDLEKYRSKHSENNYANILFYLLNFNRGKSKDARDILITFLSNYINENRQNYNTLSNDEKLELYKTSTLYFELLNYYLLEHDNLFLNYYIPLRFYNKSILKSSTYNSNYKIENKIGLIEEYRSNLKMINKLTDLNTLDDTSVAKLKSRNREIERLIPKTKDSFNLPSISGLKGILKRDEAYLEIIRINKESKNDTRHAKDIVNFFTDSIYYGAILIKKNLPPKFILIDSTSNLETKQNSIYKTNIKNRIIDYNSYQLFFEKLDIELNDIKKVYLVTDGIYNSINIETIYNPKRKLFVFDYLRVQQINSVISLIKNPTDIIEEPNQQAVLIGNPQYDISLTDTIRLKLLSEREISDSISNKIRNNVTLSPLPGTEKEVQSINLILKKNGFKVKLYTSESASEENIKRINSPRILHIATHGYFLDENKSSKARGRIIDIFNKFVASDSYLKSGLLLAGAQNTLNRHIYNKQENGILTASEAKELSLEKTELVVLSACETGLGVHLTGEGVMGLPRAFMIAGAKSVIMSLWSVSDEKTQLLMTQFYKYLISYKMKKEDALYNAKKALKEIYPDPYYWGGFVLIN